MFTLAMSSPLGNDITISLVGGAINAKWHPFHSGIAPFRVDVTRRHPATESAVSCRDDEPCRHHVHGTRRRHEPAQRDSRIHRRGAATRRPEGTILQLLRYNPPGKTSFRHKSCVVHQ